MKLLKYLLIIFYANITYAQSDVTEADINESAFGDSEFPLSEVRLIGPNVNQIVEYEDHGEYGLFESDIYIPKPDTKRRDTVQGVVIDGFRWPNGKVYFRFDNVVEEVKQAINDAINYIEQRTSVDFIELLTPSTHHILISDDIFSDNTGRSGCFSSVGYQTNSNGYQRLNLQRRDEKGRSCLSKGIAIHELLHALGMFHEQSREDRDSFVTIHYENIKSGLEYNFNKLVSRASDVDLYSYDSIMHYGSNAFSKNGLPTISPKQSGVTIGQRQFMSNSDIITIDKIYPKLTTETANVPWIYLLILDE